MVRTDKKYQHKFMITSREVDNRFKRFKMELWFEIGDNSNMFLVILPPGKWRKLLLKRVLKWIGVPTVKDL